MAKGRPKKVKSVSAPTEVVEEKPIEKVVESTEEITPVETSPVLPELSDNNTAPEVFVEVTEEPVSVEQPAPVEVTEEKVVEKTEEVESTPEVIDMEMAKVDVVSEFIKKEEKKPTRDENKLSMVIAQLKTMPMYKYLAKSSLIRIAMKKIAQQKAKTL